MKARPRPPGFDHVRLSVPIREHAKSPTAGICGGRRDKEDSRRRSAGAAGRSGNRPGPGRPRRRIFLGGPGAAACYIAEPNILALSPGLPRGFLLRRLSDAGPFTPGRPLMPGRHPKPFTRAVIRLIPI